MGHGRENLFSTDPADRFLAFDEKSEVSRTCLDIKPLSRGSLVVIFTHRQLDRYDRTIEKIFELLYS